jgi:CubicO group peptidase (beta-lactamase class C family)
MKTDVVWIAGMLFLLTNCSTKEKSSENIRLLDAYFSSQFRPDEPGGAILIMKDDSTIFSKGYGIADVRSQERITSKTLFNIGSISKTFVASAILMLQQQGKLSVEDSLIRYFPDFTNKEIGRKVKIKHLLTHTSGLPDSRHPWKDTVFYLTARDEENWAPILKTDTFEFEPGSRFKYSNPAFNGLALIVQQVSGMKWQSFVEQNLMRPSGMAFSTITDGPHPESGVSHGYVMNGGKWTEDDYGEEPTFAAAGNGGVWSSVEELALYEKAMRQSTFLSAEKVAEARTIKTFANWTGDTTRPNTGWSWLKRNDDSTDPFIGWSWFIVRNQQGLQFVGHTGSQGGFLCNFASIPEKKILFVILCNAPYDINAFSDRIVSWLEQQNLLN